MFVGRSSARRLGLLVLLGTVPLSLGACGLLIGLEDHQAFPAADAGPDANDVPDSDALDDATIDVLPDVVPDGCAGAMCGDACVDLTGDALNCGACGAACLEGFTCEGSVCGDHIEQISAGANHGCALLHDGSVWCWGNDDSGQLGIPAASDKMCDDLAACHAEPIKVVGLPGKMVQISAGSDATCALDAAGSAWCWGLNDNRQLGRLNTAGVITPFDRNPAQVPGLPALGQVVMGYRFACARFADGSAVSCWGSNEGGALGNGQVAAAGGVAPAAVKKLSTKLVDVAASLGGHACALDANGGVSCWGVDSYGQLGDDPTNDSDCGGSGKCDSTPSLLKVNVTSGTRLGASVLGTCASGDTGFVCWGSNLFGQLATTPDGSPHFLPQVVKLPPSAIASSYRGGYATSCVVTSIGGAQCWGDDTYGGLGRGMKVNTPCVGNGFCDPKAGEVKIPPGYTPIEVEAGAFWAMALTTSNRIIAWGANLDGRLGHAPGDGGDSKTCGYASDKRCNPTPLLVPRPGKTLP